MSSTSLYFLSRDLTKKNFNLISMADRQRSAVGSCCIFTLAVRQPPVWPHVSKRIFLYKFMRTRVGSPFTDIENAPQLNFTQQFF